MHLIILKIHSIACVSMWNLWSSTVLWAVSAVINNNSLHPATAEPFQERLSEHMKTWASNCCFWSVASWIWSCSEAPVRLLFFSRLLHHHACCDAVQSPSSRSHSLTSFEIISAFFESQWSQCSSGSFERDVRWQTTSFHSLSTCRRSFYGSLHQFP